MPDQNRTEPFAPMQRRRALGLVSSLPLFGLPLQAAHAQFRVEIAGVGATQLPLALTRFRDKDPSRAGSVMQMRAHDYKRNQDIPVPESRITGSSGNTSAGSLITVSGGARG